MLCKHVCQIIRNSARLFREEKPLLECFSKAYMFVKGLAGVWATEPGLCGSSGNSKECVKGREKLGSSKNENQHHLSPTSVD